MALSTEDVKVGDRVYEGVEVETFDPVPFNPSDALKSAIAAGNVRTEKVVKDFVQKDSDGTPVKVWRQGYTACFAKNLQGALALPLYDGDEKSIWQAVSEASNLRGSARPDTKRGEKEVLGEQDIYIKLRNASQGPEKAIAKVTKILGGLTPEQKAQALKELGLA